MRNCALNLVTSLIKIFVMQITQTKQIVAIKCQSIIWLIKKRAKCIHTWTLMCLYNNIFLFFTKKKKCFFKPKCLENILWIRIYQMSTIFSNIIQPWLWNYLMLSWFLKFDKKCLFLGRIQPKNSDSNYSLIKKQIKVVFMKYNFNIFCQ